MNGDQFEPAAFSGKDLGCYRGGRLVFSGLNFEVTPGSVLELRGANGSGKTTLMRLMAGLAQPAAGSLLWGGAIVDDLEVHADSLRFVGHLDAIKSAQTVSENLAFWRALWSGKTDKESVEAAMEAMGITHLADFPARHLSAGQRHRLALARVIAAPAPLWLLDEPGNALDENSLKALTQMIAGHRARGGMVVVASHGTAFVEDSDKLDLGQFGSAHLAHWSDGL
jgi:heme exporter protein A